MSQEKQKEEAFERELRTALDVNRLEKFPDKLEPTNDKLPNVERWRRNV